MDGDQVSADKLKVEDAEEEESDELEEEESEELEGEGDGENFFCANPHESHPDAQGIADSYEVSYEEVLGWFCEGNFGFGQIMLGLQTSELTDETAADILARRAGGEGWGQICQDMDLIGRPEDAEPPDEADRPP